MSGQVFEGSTVEDALARAAAELGVRIDELEHEVLEEGAEDFWGLDEPTTRIRAWLKGEGEPEAPPQQAPGAVEEEPEAGAGAAEPGPAEAPEAPEAGEEAAAGGFWAPGEGEEEAQEGPAPAVKPTKAVAEADQEAGAATATATPEEREEEARPAKVEREEEEVEREEDVEGEGEIEHVSAEDAPAGEFTGLPEEIEDPVPEIRELLARIFEDMSFDCEAEIAEDTEQIDVMISGADKDYLVESSGKGISALELILNHAFRHRLPKGRKIRVDAGDFRSRREEELRDLAFQVAHSAKQSGKTQETQELNPYERRLVHLALADDEEVTTRSRGQGFLKHVQVIPQKNG